METRAVIYRCVVLALLCFVVGGSLSFKTSASTRLLPSSLSIEWRDAQDRAIAPENGALGFSRFPLTSLPPSEDQARFRIVITGAPRRPSLRMTLLSVAPTTKKIRQRLDVPLVGQEGAAGQLVTPWLILVPCRDDCLPPTRQGRAIYARPRDIIQTELRLGGSRPFHSLMSIGPPATDRARSDIRTLKLRATVLRDSRSGSPIVGQTENDTRDIVNHQVEILKDVLAQCYIDVEAAPEDVQIAAPPEACLIAIGDRYGLPSRGGYVRFAVDNLALGPIEIAPYQTPTQTAKQLSAMLEENGYHPSLTVNSKPPTFAFPSADIVVRRPDGQLATIRPWPERSLSTDTQQTMHIGGVNQIFGIDSYDQNNSSAGTLEERTLVKCLREPQKGVINVFIVHELGDPSRQGESFIQGSTPPMAGTVIIDKQALIGARHSYTLSHEIGHVLLGDLEHPDARGDNRSFLLMHSRSSSAVGGPKHLTEEECTRIREASADLLF